MSEHTNPSELSTADLQLDLQLRQSIAQHAADITRVKTYKGEEVESLTLYTSPSDRREKVVLTADPSVDGGTNTLHGSNVLAISIHGNRKDESNGDFLYSSRDSYLHRRYQPDRLEQELTQPSESVRLSIANKLETGTPERPARQGRVARSLSKLGLSR